jgi:phenylacetate-coenzyme A ligase PaaK-like adenylate-forming protein
VTFHESETDGPAVWKYQSALPDVVWPAIPAGDGAVSLGILFQLESSQWLSPDRLIEFQMSQLEVLLRHAYSSVRHYRQAWRGLYDPHAPLTQARFSRLPLLSRRELQDFDAIQSERIPPAHGPVAEARSSGSTGSPVRVLKTQVTQAFWNALTLRDHLWRRRDLRGKLAAIRHGVPTGEFAGWGTATHGLIATGPSVVLGVKEDIDTQLRWLEEQRPEYLLTYPSNLAELIRRSQQLGIRIPGLREARTLGEVLADEVRESCRTAWGVPVADVYSAEEIGYIALQCPQHEHYHVQSEAVLVEVLDERGAACLPGEIGRVVVTTLHNFATPLVRYELGDFAVGAANCACGRGLPVIRRIMGRTRNILVSAAGKRYWPSLGSHGFPEIAPILQHQFVQKSLDLVEARLVTRAALTAEQEARLRRHILSALPAGFRLNFVYCDRIARSAGGKYEDFVSELPLPAQD